MVQPALVAVQSEQQVQETAERGAVQGHPHGEVDLADAQSKADLAATLARIQQDAEKRGINIDKDSEFKSLLARDKEMESQDPVTAADLKTPIETEVPDELEQQQEECYNEDVMYLQQYGRA